MLRPQTLLNFFALEVPFILGDTTTKWIDKMRNVTHTLLVMIKCPHCKGLMTEAYVFEHLPEDMIKSEGARLMSLSYKHKFPSKRASKAAQARWELVKQAQALGITGAHKMKKSEIHAALDKIFE
jgi:hypothetical protein